MSTQLVGSRWEEGLSSRKAEVLGGAGSPLHPHDSRSLENEPPHCPHSGLQGRGSRVAPGSPGGPCHPHVRQVSPSRAPCPGVCTLGPRTGGAHVDLSQVALVS